MDARTVTLQLRRGEEPSPEGLRRFARALATGEASDAQAGAFAMGVCLRGLSEAGRTALTLAMRDSGEVLDWGDGAPVVDKHSTGGVGDCVSLLLAPALAASGLRVPMISGRGLGHTGGTLDKLESIPGLKVDHDARALRRILAATGCFIAGASARIAPADRRLYAVRDVTGTVESVDLITASILSKKLAAGVDRLVLDVKCGSGAFMKSRAAAVELAQALVAVANAAGCRTAALVTDMDEPLCASLGNALEVALCMEVLESGRTAAPRLFDLTVALGARLLALQGDDEDTAAARLADAIASGRAMERFAAMVAAMGGPPDMDADWRAHLPQAQVIRAVPAPAGGTVAGWDGEALGLAVVALGGGRQVEGARIDHAVGLASVLPVGAAVGPGDPVAFVHARTDAGAAAGVAAVLAALTMAPESPSPRPLVLERIDPCAAPS
ncbi:MAG: thymidine phosphorylase [Rubellimicrobium sp.]|nr:thymidine phosphorylase [Rubellimicrobium sp.]